MAGMLAPATAQTWPCGHPYTADNIAGAGPGRFRCAVCNRDAVKLSKLKRQCERAEETALRILESKPVDRGSLRHMVLFALKHDAPDLCFSKIAYAIREGGLAA